MAEYRLNDFELLTKVQAFLVQPARGPYAPPELKQEWLHFEGLATPFLQRVLRRSGLVRDEREDVLQQVWLIVVRDLPAFVPRGEQALSGWLGRVARTQAGQMRRRAILRPCSMPSAVQATALPDRHADASLSAQARDYQERMQRAIDELHPKLSERDRTILVQCLVGGRRRKRVAAELGITPESVRDIVRRLRSKLRGLFRELGNM